MVMSTMIMMISVMTTIPGNTRPISRFRASAMAFEYRLMVLISIPVDDCISLRVLEQAYKNDNDDNDDNDKDDHDD